MKNGKRWIWFAAIGAIGLGLTALQMSGKGINRVRAEASVDTETRLLAKKVPDHDKRIRVLEVEQAGMRANQKTIIKTIDSMDDKIDRLLSR